MKKVCVVTMWCEWDIGCNDYIWSNLELAKRDADEHLRDMVYDDDLPSLDAVLAEGLIGFEVKEVISN